MLHIPVEDVRVRDILDTTPPVRRLLLEFLRMVSTGWQSDESRVVVGPQADSIAMGHSSFDNLLSASVRVP